MKSLNFHVAFSIITDFYRNELEAFIGKKHRCNSCAEVFTIDEIEVSLVADLDADEYDAVSGAMFTGYKSQFETTCPRCEGNNVLVTRRYYHSFLLKMKEDLENGKRWKENSIKAFLKKILG